MERILILLTLLFPLVVFGQETTVPDGNQLIVVCGTALRMMNTHSDETAKEFTDTAYCQGLVHGISSTLQADGHINLPQGATLGQLIRVVDKYLSDHPERLAEPDAVLAIAALRKAFPVRTK